MMRYFVEIHVAGAATERHEIAAAEAQIGTGVACSIRPNAVNTFLAEHVRLAPTDASCCVGLMPGVPGALMYLGVPQREVVVPWGDEVFLDGTRFTFLLETGKSKRPRPVLLLALVVAIALVGMIFVRASDSQDLSKREVEPPPLLQRPGRCAENDPSRIETLAAQAERSALAKQERSAFEVADGGRALGLLSDAAACFRAAGNVADADRLNAELSRWTAQMNEDYAATRLRLRLALEHRRWHEAFAAVDHLRALLVDHGKEPYTDWLDGLHLELERKIAAHR